MTESNGQTESPRREGTAPGRQPTLAGPDRPARASGAADAAGAAGPAAGPAAGRAAGPAADGEPRGKRRGGHRSWSRFWLILLALLIVNWVLASAVLGLTSSHQAVAYSFFLKRLKSSNVESVTATGNTIQGTFKRPVSYRPPGSARAETVVQFTTVRPAFANDDLLQELMAKGVSVSGSQGTPLWERFLFWFGPALLLGGLLTWRWRSGAADGPGTSRVRRLDPGSAKPTTFADVAGVNDVENEVVEIVDFLRDPGRYRRLGAQIPHGVLLSGAPGTGKTLLARAIAGQAGVPLFSISAPELAETNAGVGAGGMRDLVDQAKQAAPSIVFIDELEAIGRTRRGGASVGGHAEQEQALDQILTEMDGLTGDDRVVVLAATNRPDVLDQALLRPGRFDWRVTLSAPDLRGRQQILAVHTRAVPLAANVDLDTVAAWTAGMVGADLKNLVNEATLLAARRDQDQVTMPDFRYSLEKILLGTVRGAVLSPAQRERAAFYESGHALLGMLTPGADPVRKISIIRGQTTGITFAQADRYSYSPQHLRGRITGALGGRAAEEVVFGNVTTGAQDDIEYASNIARQMAGRWGMSPAIGPVSVLPPPGQDSPYGPDGVAPATRELVDAEARKIMEECYEQAVATLRGNRDRLDWLARALMERETLEEHEAYAAAGIDRNAGPAPTARSAPSGGAADGEPDGAADAVSPPATGHAPQR
jgi:cell division protease FtsH